MDWSIYWHYNDAGQMICNRCGSEVWYLIDGYICSGRIGCFNEDDDEVDK